MKFLIIINIIDLFAMITNVSLDFIFKLPQKRLNNDLNYLVANTVSQLILIFFFVTILNGIEKLMMKYQTFVNIMVHINPIEMLTVLAIMGVSVLISTLCMLGTFNKTINILKLNHKMKKQFVY